MDGNDSAQMWFLALVTAALVGGIYMHWGDRFMSWLRFRLHRPRLP